MTEAPKNIASIQTELMVKQKDSLVKEEKALKERLLRLHADEELALKKKSRDMRISLGDSNSNFFYNTMKTRQHRNSILSLQNASGDVTAGNNL